MLNKNSNVDDRSRNESNAVKPSDSEIVTLIKIVEKMVGGRDHSKGYSLEALANSFTKHYELSKCINCTNEIEKYQVDELFARVADYLDFNLYLHRLVVNNLRGVFTTDQLACIFQAYNGTLIMYKDQRDGDAKQGLFDYIDYEGKLIYNLGNIDEFKAIIHSINPIEFDVFVNLIIELWDTKGKKFGLLFDFLTSNDGSF